MLPLCSRQYLATSQVEGSVLVLIQHSQVCLPSIQQKFYKKNRTEELISSSRAAAIPALHPPICIHCILSTCRG
jgi:hypothetical protein